MQGRDFQKHKVGKVIKPARVFPAPQASVGEKSPHAHKQKKAIAHNMHPGASQRLLPKRCQGDVYITLSLL